MMSPLQATARPSGCEPLAPSPNRSQAAEAEPSDPVLCNHCGRTANNGISCIGACVADSGY